MDTGTIPLPLPGRRLLRAGWLLGFALGGFFDGILLHQILQWHHLLSAVAGAPFDDLRVQVLADGVFHALMYVIALIGLWQLMRARPALFDPGAERALAGALLIGFGFWHAVDALLSHWLLGIHHIRMDTAHPVLWDAGWLLVFGVAPIGIGVLLGRIPPPDADRHGDRRGSRSTLVPLVFLAVAGAAALAFFAPLKRGGISTATVVLRPDANAGALLAALPQAGARVMWSSPRGDVWVFALERNAHPLRLYRHGALFVSGTLLPAGCSAWWRA
jgi:uncharacterized membrane protein